MSNMHLLPRRALRQTVFYTVLFSLLAHGYRFLNMSFSGDASLIVQEEEILYQISIGRYLQPVYWQIRGYITSPLTIGLFATAALIGTAILLISLLRFTSRLQIILTCGILAVNETLSVSYATYLPWVDVYMVALFFAIAGVYVSERFRHGWLVSPLLYLITLALYQSYLQPAAALIIILLILSLLDGEHPAVIWQRGIKACLSLLFGLILYAVGLKLALFLVNASALDAYNGVTQVGIMNLTDIPNLLLTTYLYPFTFFMRSADHAAIAPILTLILLLFALPALILQAHRLSAGGKMTLAFLLGILPLGANFVCFISKGIVHPLMVYAFFFFYILCIALLSRPAAFPIHFKGSAALRFGAAATISMMLFSSIITANQLYLRRDLEFYSTTSAITRILKRADRVEGYIPGETPVCVLGYLPSSRIGFVRPGFESLSNLQGMRYTYAASYETSTVWYVQMILGYPVNFVSSQEQIAYLSSGISSQLSAFPDDNCCQIIDGVLFIRLN